ALVEPHAHALAQDVELHDLAVAGGRGDTLADLRQRLAHLLVDILFVYETTLERAALTRHLRRVEHQALILGHLDRDRHERRQPRRAAQLAAARADAADQLGLVARADLPHLDARVQPLREILDQVAEVDPLLRREIEQHLARLERVLDAHHLHRQAALADALAAEDVGLALAAGVLLLRARVGVGGGAQDAAQGIERRHAARRDGDGGGERAAIGLDHHAVAARVARVAGVVLVDGAGVAELDAGDVGERAGLDGVVAEIDEEIVAVGIARVGRRLHGGRARDLGGGGGVGGGGLVGEAPAGVEGGGGALERRRRLVGALRRGGGRGRRGAIAIAIARGSGALGGRAAAVVALASLGRRTAIVAALGGTATRLPPLGARPLVARTIAARTILRRAIAARAIIARMIAARTIIARAFIARTIAARTILRATILRRPAILRRARSGTSFAVGARTFGTRTFGTRTFG